MRRRRLRRTAFGVTHRSEIPPVRFPARKRTGKQMQISSADCLGKDGGMACLLELLARKRAEA